MITRRPRPAIAANARVVTLARSAEPDGVTSNVGHPTEPVVVELSLSGPEPVVVLSEGSGHLGSGGTFWVDEILTDSHGLQDRWQSTFERADALWLIPLLARLLTGETVTAQTFQDTYRRRHGSFPVMRSGTG